MVFFGRRIQVDCRLGYKLIVSCSSCPVLHSGVEVVLKPEYANEAARVAEQLQPAVGRVTTIMSQEAHAARELADNTLREAKERQRAGVATGAQTMKVADRILELYGQGGSQRKRFWSSIIMTSGERRGNMIDRLLSIIISMKPSILWSTIYNVFTTINHYVDLWLTTIIQHSLLLTTIYHS